MLRLCMVRMRAGPHKNKVLILVSSPTSSFASSSFTLPRIIHASTSTRSNSSNLSQQRLCFSTYAAEAQDEEQQQQLQQHHPHYHAWLDPQLDLNARAEMLLGGGHGHGHGSKNDGAAVSFLHPAAHREAAPLIRQLCKQNTLQCMQQATEIVERLVLEKKRLYNNEHFPSKNNENDDNDKVLVCIPAEAWQILMYGWASMMMAERSSQQHYRVAQVRMKELMSRVVEEALWDKERAVSSSPQQQDSTTTTTSSTTTTTSSSSTRIRPASFPTVDIYNTFLFGLAQAAKFDSAAAVRANELLSEMTLLHNAPEYAWHCRPNTKSYMNAIVACSNAASAASGSVGTNLNPGRCAFDILQQMKTAHLEEKIRYQEQFHTDYDSHHAANNRRKIVTPDVMAYTATMKALIDSSSSSTTTTTTQAANDDPSNNNHNNDNLQLVELLFHELLDSASSSSDDNDNDFGYLYDQVDAHVFVAAISAFGKRVQQERTSSTLRIEYAQHAERILGKAVEFFLEAQAANNNKGEEGNNNNNNNSNKFCNSASLLLPAFNACLDVWSRTYVPDAPLQCERILHTMLSGGGGDGGGESSDTTLLPDDNMSSLSSSSSSLVIAEPNVISFNCCLFAWSRANKFHSGNNYAAVKARELLEIQHELCEYQQHRQKHSLPDFQSYTLAILARAHGANNDDEPFGKMRDARELLETMLNRLQNGKVQRSRNTTAPFSAVLTAAAKSPRVVVATTQQQQHGNETTSKDSDSEDPFNSVVETENDTYSLALRTYHEIVNDVYNIGTVPDHHCFSAMLRCIAQHCDERSAERESTARIVFDTACQEGQVSRLVVDALVAVLGEQAVLRREASSSSSPSSSSSNNIDINRMPRFWFRNVPASFRYYPGNQRKQRRRRSTKS